MVKAFLKKQYHSPLFRGGLIVFIGSFGVGGLNYVFNIIVARILDKEQLGAFASLFSLLNILVVFGGALTLVVIKFTSVLYAKKDYPALASFIRILSYYLGIISLGLIILFGLLSPFIYRFLHLESFGPLIILAIALGLSLIGSIGTSVLQGTQRFTQFTLSSLFGTIIKIIALILFTLPFWPMSSITGAMISVPVSGILMLALSLYFLRDILSQYDASKSNLPHFKWKDIIIYTIPTTITVLGITLLNSVDVILAKHYLISDASGDYAALSTLGKIIFFATSAIPMAMFPIVSARHAVDEPHRKMLFASLGSVALMSFAAFLMYQFFPEFIINTLIGSKFMPIAPLLGKFAIIMGMYSLINVIINYYLSIQRYSIGFIPILGSISLAILLYLNNSSLEIIVNMVLYNMIGLFSITIITGLILKKVRSKK